MAAEEKLVYFDEVEEAYNSNPTKALKELVDKMLKLDQSKVELSVFTKAAEIRECARCGCVFHDDRWHRMTNSVECYGAICVQCESLIKEKDKNWRDEIKLQGQWKNLLDALQVLSDDYKFDYYIDRGSDERRFRGIIIVDSENDKFYARITRESYGGYKYPYNTKHALRIHSDDYNIKFDKLRSDFDANNIVNRMHDKCVDVLQRQRDKKQYKEDANDLCGEFESAMREKFSVGHKLQFINNDSSSLFIDGVKVNCYNWNNDKIDSQYTVAGVKVKRDDEPHYDWEQYVYFPESALLEVVDAISTNYLRKD